MAAPLVGRRTLGVARLKVAPGSGIEFLVCGVLELGSRGPVCAAGCSSGSCVCFDDLRHNRSPTAASPALWGAAPPPSAPAGPLHEVQPSAAKRNRAGLVSWPDPIERPLDATRSTACRL